MNRRRFLGWGLSTPAAALLAQTGPPREEPVEAMMPEEGPAIALNHLGFLPGARKTVIFRYSGENGPEDFQIREIGGGDGAVRRNKVNIGNGYPKYTWGFTNLITYKGIELSFLIIASHGNDLFNTLRIRRETYEATDPKVLNIWTTPGAPPESGVQGPENENTPAEALYDGQWVLDQHLPNKYIFGTNPGTTSRWVEDASFIRLKTITLAYNVETKLLTKVGFTKARVYVSGTNLLTSTKYTGYDPEIAAFPSNDAEIGVDLSVYPTSKTYTLGIDFTF